MLFVYVGAYALVLIALAAFVRHSVWGTFALALAALCTAPLWGEHLDGWFRWIKTLSVLVPTAFLICIARIAHHDDRGGVWRFWRGDWVLWAFWAMFALNIAEASVKDITLGNTLNGVAGLVLILLLPWVRYPGSDKKNWTFSDENRGDVYGYTGWAWNVAYVSWNLAFIYNENPSYFASSATLLLATLGYTFMVGKPQLFAMLRPLLLALHLTLRAATDIFPNTLDKYPVVQDPAMSMVWGAVNFALLFVLLILSIRGWSGAPGRVAGSP